MSMIGQLASGMLATCEIFVLTLVFSLPLGLLVAFGRMSKIKPVQLITKIYISIMRGTRRSIDRGSSRSRKVSGKRQRCSDTRKTRRFLRSYFRRW